jgi:hypothetical protein
MGLPVAEVDVEAQGGMGATANPRNLGQLGAGMNRPFEQVVGPDQKIYIACRADYGQPGGGLAVLDPFSKSTSSAKVFRDTEQSVQAVAADSVNVYFGTSVLGGRGSAETTTEAQFVIWDVSRQARDFSCVPVAGAVAVTSLAVARGLIVGTTAPSTSWPHGPASAFVFSLAQRQVTRTLQLCSGGTPLAGVPEAHGICHIICARDGDVYGVAGRWVFKIDMSTLRLVVLDRAPISDLYQIVEAPLLAEEAEAEEAEGNVIDRAEGGPTFYMAAQSHVLRYSVQSVPHFR